MSGVHISRMLHFQDVGFSGMWQFSGSVSLQHVALSRMWRSPGCCIFRMSHSPACDSLQDLFSDWSGSFPGSGTPQHAGRAPTEGDPGCGIFQNVAVSRMWHFPGSGISSSRIWHSPGGGIIQDVTFPRM